MHLSHFIDQQILFFDLNFDGGFKLFGDCVKVLLVTGPIIFHLFMYYFEGGVLLFELIEFMSKFFKLLAETIQSVVSVSLDLLDTHELHFVILHLLEHGLIQDL